MDNTRGVTETLLGEFLASLYPQLLRIVRSSIDVQTLLRVLVYAGISYAFVRKGYVKPDFIQGAVNTLHILSSYFAFRSISSGNALALFYTYPLWNLVLSKVFLRESLDATNVSFTFVGVIGATMIALSSMTTDEKQKGANLYGVLAALLAAVTESIMYIAYHDKTLSETPVERVFGLYSGSIPYVLILCGVRWATQGTKGLLKDTTLRGVGLMIGFNSIVGILSHVLRANAMLRLRADVFSALSLTGIIMGYLTMFLLEGKKPTKLALLGAVLVGAAGVFVTINKQRPTEQPPENI